MHVETSYVSNNIQKIILYDIFCNRLHTPLIKRTSWEKSIIYYFTVIDCF